jgi:hypothetical protein
VGQAHDPKATAGAILQGSATHHSQQFFVSFSIFFHCFLLSLPFFCHCSFSLVFFIALFYCSFLLSFPIFFICHSSFFYLSFRRQEESTNPTETTTGKALTAQEQRLLCFYEQALLL